MPVSTGSEARSTAYAKSLQVAGTAGVLNAFTGYNSGPAQWLQVHNGTALPSNGATPVYTQSIAGTASFSAPAGFRAIACANGVVLCNSTTGPTLTQGADDCWFNAWHQ